MTFLNHIEKFRNKVAIVENNKSFTYKDLEERSFEYCNKIQRRSLVFLLAENDLDTISFYLGLLKSKSVIVLFCAPSDIWLQLGQGRAGCPALAWVRWTSVQWGAWSEVGMASRGAAAVRFAALATTSGYGTLGLAEGLLGRAPVYDINKKR